MGSAEFLGESDEKPFRPADVAEPIRVFILDDFAYELRSDTSGSFSFDRGPPFELEAELAKEINCPSEVIDDDSYVVHTFERHVFNLQGVVESNNGLFLQRRSTTRRGAREIARE